MNWVSGKLNSHRSQWRMPSLVTTSLSLYFCMEWTTTYNTIYSRDQVLEDKLQQINCKISGCFCSLVVLRDRIKSHSRRSACQDKYLRGQSRLRLDTRAFVPHVRENDSLLARQNTKQNRSCPQPIKQSVWSRKKVLNPRSKL